MKYLVPVQQVKPPSTVGRSRFTSPIVLARAQVSRRLSRRLPYYLTPEEAHLLIESTENERDQIFLRLLWETGQTGALVGVVYGRSSW